MVEWDVESIEYDQYSNRQLAAIPLALLALALLSMLAWSLFVTGTPAAPGSPVSLGIDFTGGTELQVVAPGGREAIQDAFDRPATVRPIVQGREDAYIVTFQVQDVGSDETSSLVQAANDAGFEVLAVQDTSATFGASAQGLALGGIVAAFVGMSVVVFILFRTALPSLAVVVSAFSDVVIPLAVMNLLGIQLSLGTVAALLMLIGYSVDSDILLNNHVLRRRGGFYESSYRAMRTGVSMTLTSMSASVVMAIVASLFGIDLLAAIGTVLAIGLATDLVNTYMLNLSLLRWYRGLHP